MTIGIDLKVCRKTRCEHWKNDDGYCHAPKKIPEDKRTGKCNTRTAGCPMPPICSYKNLHIIVGIKQSRHGCYDENYRCWNR